MNVVYLSDYMTRGCCPTATEAFADDLKLMARHIRANAGDRLYFGALADELERAARHCAP